MDGMVLIGKETRMVHLKKSFLNLIVVDMMAWMDIKCIVRKVMAIVGMGQIASLIKTKNRMEKSLISFVYMILFFHLVGCKSNKMEEYMPYLGSVVPLINMESSQPKVLDWDNAEEVDFQNVIEDIRYIPLGDEADVMGQIGRLLYHEGVFYVYDRSQDEVFLFNERGRCFKKISDRGPGPREYFAIGGIDINPEGTELLIDDRMSSNVLFYDLKGEFKRKRKLPVQNGQTYSLGDSTILVQMETFQNNGSEEMEGYGYLVIKGDSAYRKGFKYLPSQIGFCGTNGIIDSYDNQSLFYKPLFSDSIYRVVSDSSCSLAYYFKDEKSVWKSHWKSKKFVNMMTEKGTSLIEVYDMKDELLALVADRIEKKQKVMIYDKLNDKTYYMKYDRAETVSKIHYMWGLDTYGVYKGEYIACLLSSGYIVDKMQTRVKNGELEITNPELKNIVMDMDHDSNPVLVLVKFKLPRQ